MNFKFILLIPLLEILAFILFGDFFGFFLVIFMIFFTGLIGLFLFSSKIDVSEITKLAKNPNEWVYKKLAGILLIIPGFVTDFLGFVILIKSFRRLIWNLLINQKKFNNQTHKQDLNKENIIEADYKDLDE